MSLKKWMTCMLASVVMMTSVLSVSAAVTSPSIGPVTKNETVTKKVGGVTAKVTTSTSGTAALGTVKKNNKKSITVSETVKVDNIKYRLTTVKSGAFKKCTKTKKITLPKTIRKINKKAFTGAKKLKTIVINSKKSVLVKKGAFKGLNTKKMTITARKMSKKQLKKFKAALKKAGFRGKVK